MEFLQRDLNIIANDKERNKRKQALGRVANIVGDSALDAAAITAIVRTCVRSLEDPAEACREAAVELLEKILPRLGDDGPDWLLPVIQTRMCSSDAAEPSEQQRLDVFTLATSVMRKYRHDIGPRGFVGTLCDIIAGALKDKFPDLLKAALKACVNICECEPKGMKHFATPLAKLVKAHGLQHKHSSVRVEAVQAFGALISHGAVEMLQDSKDELDNRTTVFFISVLAHDHTDQVRRATLRLLERLLTDITDRLEQHRRLVPIVLALLSDTAQDIRDGSLALMETLGKIYKVDHEDNSIQSDVKNRRITVKDMEWYGDDSNNNNDDDANGGGGEAAVARRSEMMKMTFSSQFDIPDLTVRPSLGARLVVSECARHFIDKTLQDLTAVDWLIPFSTVSRRMVALRVLHMLFFFSETNIVQHAEPILGALFKTLLHEDKPVRQESQFCVELLGKYLSPKFYLPILLRRDASVSADAAPSLLPAASSGGKNKKGGENGDDAAGNSDSKVSATTVVRRGTATVTTTVTDADADPNAQPLPTLFQCAAASTKRGILVALRCLLLGTTKLEAAHAKQLVQALCDADLLDLDAPLLVVAHAEVIEGLIEVLCKHHYIATPDKPLPQDIRDRADQRTLDSMLFVVLLAMLACSDQQKAPAAVRGIIERCSLKITGEKNGWFDIHCLRILSRHATTLAPEAFAELMDKTTDLSGLGDVLTNLFVARLSNVNYHYRVVSELRLLGELRKVLGHAAGSPKSVVFSADQQELLIRSVILYHMRFVPGNTSHLFNKLALQCLRELLKGSQRRDVLKSSFQKPWEETNDPRVTPTPLSEKIVSAWLGMMDNDDSEVRVTAVEMIYDIAMLPLSNGLASEMLSAMLNRLDDNSDPIRLLLAQQLFKVLTTPEDGVSPALVGEVKGQLATMTKRCLLHLDDVRETIGIKDQLCQILKRLCGVNCQLVHSMTREVRSKHSTPQYCDDILGFTPNN